MPVDRFLRAQEDDYNIALREIRAGRKQTHWIWYIFPQLKGLGRIVHDAFCSGGAFLHGLSTCFGQVFWRKVGREDDQESTSFLKKDAYWESMMGESSWQSKRSKLILRILENLRVF